MDMPNFTNRPLAEITIVPHEVEAQGVDNFLAWCEAKSTFSHQLEAEYIFWVPPLETFDKAVASTYGDILTPAEEISVAAPDIIIAALRLLSHKFAKSSDPGYLLVRFEE